MLERKTLMEAKRIVVKVGTSTLTHSTGKPNLFRIEQLAMDLADLANQGKEIVLVFSGAVGAGMARLGMAERPKTIPEKQAAAAVGQGLLMHIYEKAFSEFGQVVAQVLLTREDSVNRSRYANSRNTLLTLLNYGVIPIINENDAVAIEELKIGDNDTLSAMVANIVDADLLIILSDIDGVYTANPQIDPTATLMHEIPDITEAVENAAGGAGSSRGTGGMYTKIQAAKMVVNSGIAMVIASGLEKGVVRRILQGENIGTLFLSRENRLQFRKRWLAFGSRVKGSIQVDAGCERAVVEHGSSLLAAGIVACQGTFSEGMTVSIVSSSGREIARGLVNYSSEDIERLKGAHTDEIAGILGVKTYDEVVHRDNMVLLA